jgi:hypothetical protein
MRRESQSMGRVVVTGNPGGLAGPGALGGKERRASVASSYDTPAPF